MGTECKSSTYNFGVYATGPADYLNIYSYFKKKNLKKVIVVLTYNDIEINTRYCQTFKELRNGGYPKINKIKMCDTLLQKGVDNRNDTFLKRIDNILERTRIWRFIRDKLANIPFLKKYYGRTILPVLYQNQQSEQFIVYLNILKQLQIDAKKNEIKIDFVFFPDVFYLKDKSYNQRWQPFIETAKTEGIIINDAWEYIIENKDSNNMAWSLTDRHPNCKAHEIMANYIVEKIL